MNNMEITENWYYVIVRAPGTPKEEFLGFTDEESREKFLPVFKSKQDAKVCFAKLPKDLFSGEYDVHAVIEEDILVTAKNEGHQVFIVDDKGRILDQLG